MNVTERSRIKTILRRFPSAADAFGWYGIEVDVESEGVAGVTRQIELRRFAELKVNQKWGRRKWVADFPDIHCAGAVCTVKYVHSDVSIRKTCIAVIQKGNLNDFAQLTVRDRGQCRGCCNLCVDCDDSRRGCARRE